MVCNKRAGTLIDIQIFSMGQEPYFRPETRIILGKVHFVVEIGTIYCKKCYFSALQVNFPRACLLSLSNVPEGTFIPNLRVYIQNNNLFSMSVFKSPCFELP